MGMSRVRVAEAGCWWKGRGEGLHLIVSIYLSNAKSFNFCDRNAISNVPLWQPAQQQQQ